MNHIPTLLIFSLFLFSCTGKQSDVPEKKHLLPLIGPKTHRGQGDTLYHSIGNFSFTNQFGDSISNKTIAGKIYVADFFFATCQSICPVMSTQMGRVQEAFKNNTDVLILSHTVNPLHDTVEVLHQYGNKYGAIRNKWHLLTGNKKEIYALAKNSYLVNALEDDGSEEGFLHSETFLLIDRQLHIRGVYDGTDSLQVNKLIKDIITLQQEHE